MANYDTYVLVTVLPPAIIIFTILLSSYCAWGISYLRFTIQKRRARQNVTTNVVIEYPGLQYMYIAMQVVFGNRLHARRTQDRVKVRLFGEEMSPGAIPLIIQLIALALGLSLAVFVTVLTVETGQVCNERWDCFPFDYTSQVRPLRTEPIQNCSLYQSNSIVCFHFTIRLIDALSNSGGILALIVIGSNFYLAFLLTLVRAQFCKVKAFCGCLLVFLIGCIILLSTLLWILPLVLDQNETLKLVRNWESFLIYYYTVVYIIAAATVLPFCVPRHLQGFGTCGSTARRYLGGRDDESETPDEESSDEEESQPVQTRATSNRNGNHAHQTSYYGLHREHQSRERLNKPPSAVSQPAGDHEPQSDASQTSDTPIASGAKNIRDETNPLVTTAEPQHLTKRSSSKRASGSLRKNKAARKRREERRRGRGGHWTETKDRGREEEWSTSEDDYRHRNNGNKTETSSEEEVEEHSPQGGAEGREGREGGGEQESARIRAVLTGEGVENGAKGGDVSVRTHL